MLTDLVVTSLGRFKSRSVQRNRHVHWILFADWQFILVLVVFHFSPMIEVSEIRVAIQRQNSLNVFNSLIKVVTFGHFKSVVLRIRRQISLGLVLNHRTITINWRLWRYFRLRILFLERLLVLNVTYTTDLYLFGSLELFVRMLKLNRQLAVKVSDLLHLFGQCVVPLFHDLVLAFELCAFLYHFSVLLF